MKSHSMSLYMKLWKEMSQNGVFILDNHSLIFCLADCQLKLILVSLVLGCYDNAKILPWSQFDALVNNITSGDS